MSCPCWLDMLICLMMPDWRDMFRMEVVGFGYILIDSGGS